MQAHKISIFKPWVSEWMARSVIFAILMTCLFNFAFYAIPAAAMGFYGIEPADVQYAMVVMYGSTVAFLALDLRIVKYFAARKYLLSALAADTVCCLLCFHFKNWPLFVICQFVQGITCALMSGIVLQLIFPRLQSVRSRVIAYSILYGSIQIAAPFYSILASLIIHYFDFNWLYYSFTVILAILAAAVLITMNGRARFTKKIPLYQVDWTGYVLYLSFLLILGFILVYGRPLGWLDSPLLLLLTAGDLCILLLFINRELRLKRPLINLDIFKADNVVLGLLLLFTFYIFKGTTGMAYGHLELILGNDPLSTIPVWTAVISGTILSMLVTSRFILMGFSLARIIITGFGIMAVYYAYMILFVSIQGETADFILPMFIYGTATGVLFVPIVSFTASSAPAKIALNASLAGIAARFTGFTASLAFSSELQLAAKASVREKIQEALNDTSAKLPATMLDIQNHYINAGSDSYTAKIASSGYFNQMIGRQILARAIRDYYDYMLTGVIAVIVILILLPQIQDVILKLRKNNIPY